MFGIEFLEPNYFYLLILLLILIGYYILQGHSRRAYIHISSLGAFSDKEWSVKSIIRHFPPILQFLAIALVIVAMARPVNTLNSSNTSTIGIDMALSMDVSSSMLARDFKPNRLEVAKEVAGKFVSQRIHDRFAIVMFASESFTMCPITHDRNALLKQISLIKENRLLDGTAIGNGLASAVNKLKDSKAKSKVIILLTDGVNNSGEISPITAGELAKTFGIKVYTIGIGSSGTAPMPGYDRFGQIVYIDQKVEIDEKLLGEISAMTGGKYFRATSKKSLVKVYEEIDKLEKTELESENYQSYEQLFWYALLGAIVLIILSIIIKFFVIKQIP